jgi:uncharacterized phage protein (TIGR01671 family)
MERQIKFRCWDGKRMTTSGIMFNCSTGCLEVPKTVNDPEMILMQYTGLKDKNGKEIYEGDIVQSMKDDWSFCDGWANDDERWIPYNKKEKEVPKIVDVTDVVTMDRFPVYWLKNEDFGYEGEHLQTPEYFEVIGNIHENPDLL